MHFWDLFIPYSNNAGSGHLGIVGFFSKWGGINYMVSAFFFCLLIMVIAYPLVLICKKIPIIRKLLWWINTVYLMNVSASCYSYKSGLHVVCQDSFPDAYAGWYAALIRQFPKPGNGLEISPFCTKVIPYISAAAPAWWIFWGNCQIFHQPSELLLCKQAHLLWVAWPLEAAFGEPLI